MSSVSYDKYRLNFHKPADLQDYWWTSAVATNGVRYYYFITKEESDGRFHLEYRTQIREWKVSDACFFFDNKTYSTLGRAKIAANKHFLGSSVKIHYYTINTDRCGRVFLDTYDFIIEDDGGKFNKYPGSVPFPTLEQAHTYIALTGMEKLPCT